MNNKFCTLLFTAISIAGIISCNKSKEKDPKPTVVKTDFPKDTAISCSNFDGSIMGNSYHMYMSIEEQNKNQVDCNCLPYGGWTGSISFETDSTASFRSPGDDVMQIVQYKILNNEIILTSDSYKFTFKDECEEKLYDANSRVWYKYIEVSH